jgi:hypothetical protein
MRGKFPSDRTLAAMTKPEMAELRDRLRVELQEDLAMMRANLYLCEVRGADRSRPVASWIARLRANRLREMVDRLAADVDAVNWRDAP